MWVGFWKAEAKKAPYVHPYRNEKGSFSTKENDAFASTGTNRGDHKANLELAKKHGFQVTVPRRIPSASTARVVLYLSHVQLQNSI